MVPTLPTTWTTVYRVVAVEADPLKAADCAQRLAPAIAAGRLHILNTGIAAEPGTLTFYRNLENGGWSSFDPHMGTRGGRFEVLNVACIPLVDVLRKHGVPFYLKIDIEGFDEVAVASLTPEFAPPYISVEAGLSGNLLPLLARLGYRHFKLINQELHTTALEITDGEWGWRLLRKTGRWLPPLAAALRALPRSWHRKTEWDRPYEHGGRSFGHNMTGPFAEDTEGVWSNYAATLRRLERICAHTRKHSNLLWLDVHAKL